MIIKGNNSVKSKSSVTKLKLDLSISKIKPNLPSNAEKCPENWNERQMDRQAKGKVFPLCKAGTVIKI
jgi:hypothetical protein